MNLVDSSGWLEYFGECPNASKFALPLEDIKHLIVPTICIYEVFKLLLQQKRSEDEALIAIGTMQKAIVVALEPKIAVEAAKLSFQLKLPMADSIILTTARIYEATLWTQDADFKGLPGVKYYENKS
jgi:predicted nucleic acid-binding protein